MKADPHAPLRPDQVPVPIRWWVRSPVEAVPPAPDTTLEAAFGGPTRSRKLRSWGHDPDGVHWLATVNGTILHTDPAYRRYTFHLVVRNDGWRIRGISDEHHPPMTPGALYCLDTHSPHAVVRDDRLPWTPPGYKLQIALDADEILTAQEVWPLLRRYLDHDPADTAATAPPVAPKPRRH